MKIDSEDSRLTPSERQLVHQIAHQLDQWRDYQPVPPLPEGYRPSLENALAVVVLMLATSKRAARHGRKAPEPRVPRPKKNLWGD